MSRAHLVLGECKKDAIATYMKLGDFTSRLNQNYVAGYEDFHFDAKEAYPRMDFDSFKVPIAVESSLLQTSSEEVNIMDDASTEPAKDDAELAKDNLKSGENALSGLSQNSRMWSEL